MEEIKLKTINMQQPIQYKRGKSLIVIGDSNKGGIDIKIEVSTKFNWLQKKLWKYLLNIKIEDIKEESSWKR